MPDDDDDRPRRTAPLKILGKPRSQPLYRVVEVTRDSTGRLKEEGKVWHADLSRARKFGRAVAANTLAHKVKVADGAGDALEELAVAGECSRTPAWSNWEQIPLPPLPPRPPKPAKLKQLPLATPRLPAPAAAEATPAPTPVPAPADEKLDTRPAELDNLPEPDSAADVMLP